MDMESSPSSSVNYLWYSPEMNITSWEDLGCTPIPTSFGPCERDPPYVIMERVLSVISGPESVTLHPLEPQSNIHFQGAVADQKKLNPEDEAMSCLLSKTLGDNMVMQCQVSDTNVNTVGSSNSTIVDNSIHQLNRGPQTTQDFALPEMEPNSVEGMSVAGPDSQQTSKPEGNSTPSSRRHSKSAVSILRNWFEDHLSHPCPSDRQLYQISVLTGLTMKQVGIWCSNEREKHRRKGVERAGVGLKKRNNHPDSAIKVLKDWVDIHWENPSPTTMEKKLLAQEAKLTLQQVSFWFENYRKKQRQLLGIQKKDHPNLMQMWEGRPSISNMDAQEPGEATEVQHQIRPEATESQHQIGSEATESQHQIGLENPEIQHHQIGPDLQPKKDQDLGLWDVELFLSYLNEPGRDPAEAQLD